MSKKEIKVLDKGFVRLVDSMGDDTRIVAAARVSYGGGTSTFRKDRSLIRYLLRHRHTSPFEQVITTFHVKLPIFVARQWVRHRTARINERSGRYSVLNPEFYVPEADNINEQAKSNNQGRGERLNPKISKRMQEKLEKHQEASYALYEEFLADDTSRELARIHLPLNTYTEWYWQIDLHNCFHFLSLRLSDHAQYEIRVYAQAIFSLLQEIVPIACEAFEDYIYKAEHFSCSELAIIQEFARRVPEDELANLMRNAGISGREKDEFIEKMNLDRNNHFIGKDECIEKMNLDSNNHFIGKEIL